MAFPKTDDEIDVETDEVEDEEVEQEEVEDESEEESEDESEPAPFDSEELITRITGAVESKIDSRISGLMKTLKDDYGLKKPKPNKPESESIGSNPNLVRVLRAAARDAVALEFDDKEERKFATGLVKELVDARGLADDEDEEAVAALLVDRVKMFMDEAKAHYASVTTKDLERRGRLKPSDDPPQPTKKKTGKPGPSMIEQFAAGKEAAKSLYGADK